MLSNAIDELVFYFTNFAFVRYALIVGVLIALCASLIGVTLVLKRFSFIGQGLSNVAFGTIAVATAIGLVSERLSTVMNLTNNLILVLPVTVGASILLLRTSQNAKINGDAAIAMISVGTLAVGYLIMNLFPKSANLSGDVCTTLFGAMSILTLTMTDVWICAGLSVLVIAVFCLFYHKIFSVTFDQDFATATGTKAKTYNLILAIVIGVIIVLAINLVGTLLISALVIFPALTAMRLFKTFLSVTICSCIAAVTCAALGIVISILSGTPVGSTIVTVNIGVFGVFWVVSLVKRRFA
ncbi:MAG: metal ABC transporter permease [Oscillospiraceae bacterium]|nr:metal ABC transporter permease [Oscillospiraceae bacterium]